MPCETGSSGPPWHPCRHDGLHQPGVDDRARYLALPPSSPDPDLSIIGPLAPVVPVMSQSIDPSPRRPSHEFDRRHLPAVVAFAVLAFSVVGAFVWFDGWIGEDRFRQDPTAGFVVGNRGRIRVATDRRGKVQILRDDRTWPTNRSESVGVVVYSVPRGDAGDRPSCQKPPERTVHRRGRAGHRTARSTVRRRSRCVVSVGDG